MTDTPGRLKLIALFIVLSMLIMFVDGLVFDNYNSRPSMAMMHMEMQPVVYNDPAAPSLDEYWSKFFKFPAKESDPDAPMTPEIVYEDGVEIKVYHITIFDVLQELRPGVKVPMFGFNQRVPGQTIRVTEGDHVRVIFYNNATDPHTIHWHGINNVTNENDGVPDVTQEPVLPGQSFEYDFVAGPTGTKFYHCHVEAPHHINMGMFGALIVDPLPAHGGKDQGSPFGPADKEYTLFLSEYDTSHAHAPYPGDMMTMGPDGQLPWLITPGRKFMMPFDPNMNEFLINGKSFPYDKPLLVHEGDVVHLRLINVGSMPHSIHIHGHEFTVTHRDGYLLPAPFQVDTILIGSAERYDVWFKANNPGLWMLHDHAMGAMANGYDPGGMMAVIQYDDYSSEAFDQFLQRAAVYEDNIEHEDEDHGMRAPSTPVGGTGMEEMGGMDH